MATSDKPTTKATETPKDGELSLQERLRLLDEKEAALAARESQIKEREDEAAAADERGGSRKFRPGEKPIKGDTAYRFQVGPRARDKYPSLPLETVTCCDETEAIRWYVMTHEDPKFPGKQIDPTVVLIEAKCLDANRIDRLKKDQAIASIRAKVEKGMPVSEADMSLLDEFDATRLEQISG